MWVLRDSGIDPLPPSSRDGDFSPFEGESRRRQQGVMLVTYVVAVLTVGVPTAAALGQATSISGPILGFVQDAEGVGVWPILGVSGAAALPAQPIELGVQIRKIAISQKRNYAIGVRDADRQPVLIPLTGGVVAPIDGALPDPAIIGVSPQGSAAVLYNEASRRAQIITGFPDAVVSGIEFDASSVAGRIDQIAVSDDGAAALLHAVEGGQPALWAIDAASAWRIPASRPGPAAFFPNRRDAVFADDAAQQVIVLRDIGGSGSRLPLNLYSDAPGVFSGVAVSEDGRTVYIAKAKSDNIAVVDLETRRQTTVSCQCPLAGIYPLKAGVFRLSEPSAGPITVLDASSSSLRVSVIPTAGRLSSR